MFNNTNNLIDLHIKKLQPLNSTILRINEVCNDPEASIIDVCKLIEKDPVLKAKILKSANSPLYSFKNNISSINQAISLFGMTTTKGLILKTILNEQGYNNINSYGVLEDDFLILILTQTRKAKEISKQLSLEINDERTLCDSAFLYELGKLITSNIIHTENKSEDFLRELNSINSNEELEKLEKDFIFSSSLEVTFKILEKWNIEKEVRNLLNSIISNKEHKLKKYLYSIIEENNIFMFRK